MPSERYQYFLDQCVQHHATKKTFSGKGCLKHVGRILELVEETGSTSALDFGCGKGAQYDKEIEEYDGKTLGQLLGERGLTFIRKYDPAVPSFSDEPEGQMWDFVWCTDVLEHIPEEDIDEVLSRIGSLASKCVFLTIATYPAKKNLPDGSNAHVTIKTAQWWRTRVARLKKAYPALRVEALIE